MKHYTRSLLPAMYKVKDFKAVAGVGDMTYQLLVGEYLLNIDKWISYNINGYL